MATYAEKQIKTIGEINDALDRLDQTLAGMAQTDDEQALYSAQEKALQEIKTVISKEKEMARREAREVADDYEQAGAWVDQQLKLVDEIDAKIDKLNETLTKMDNTDSRVKGFYEQEKAIHEIRSILSKVEQLGAKTDY